MSSMILCRDSESGSLDRKSTRLNSSHLVISYAVFCLKKADLRDAHSVGRLLGAAGDLAATGPSHREGARSRAQDQGQQTEGVFFFNDPATTEIYTLSLHDALPI